MAVQPDPWHHRIDKTSTSTARPEEWLPHNLALNLTMNNDLDWMKTEDPVRRGSPNSDLSSTGRTAYPKRRPTGRRALPPSPQKSADGSASPSLDQSFHSTMSRQSYHSHASQASHASIQSLTSPIDSPGPAHSSPSRSSSRQTNALPTPPNPPPRQKPKKTRRPLPVPPQTPQTPQTPAPPISPPQTPQTGSEAREREEREKLEREQREREQREREQKEREQKEREAKEREQKEREQKEREQQERERLDRERRERERIEFEQKQRALQEERERLHREQTERERREREDNERQQKEREQKEREQKEREQKDREQKDREQKDREEKEREEKEREEKHRAKRERELLLEKERIRAEEERRRKIKDARLLQQYGVPELQRRPRRENEPTLPTDRKSRVIYEEDSDSGGSSVEEEDGPSRDSKRYSKRGDWFLRPMRPAPPVPAISPQFKAPSPKPSPTANPAAATAPVPVPKPPASPGPTSPPPVPMRSPNRGKHMPGLSVDMNPPTPVSDSSSASAKKDVTKEPKALLDATSPISPTVPVNGKSRRKPVPALAKADEQDTAKTSASPKTPGPAMRELEVIMPDAIKTTIAVDAKGKPKLRTKPINIAAAKKFSDSPTSPTGPPGTAIIKLPPRETTTPSGSPATTIPRVFENKAAGASADSLLQDHILMFNNMAQLQSIVAHTDELVEDYPNWRVFRDETLYAEATPEYASLLNKHVLQQGMSLSDLDEVMGCPGLDGVPGGHRRRKPKKGDKEGCVVM